MIFGSQNFSTLFFKHLTHIWVILPSQSKHILSLSQELEIEHFIMKNEKSIIVRLLILDFCILYLVNFCSTVAVLSL